MFLNSAVHNTLCFIQAWHIASKLRGLLDLWTEVPRYAKDVTKLHKLHWLNDYFQPDKTGDHQYDEIKRLILMSFNSYHMLDWEMWRCEVS